MTNTNFPQFDKYTCVGDSITWQCEGFDITARIEPDGDTRPDQFDCYAPEDVQRSHWVPCT